MAGRPALPRAVFDFESPTLELPEAVVLDTSFVANFLNPAEAKHDACVDFIERLTRARTTLIYNRLMEIELAEVAFRIAIRERHGSNKVTALRWTVDADSLGKWCSGRLLRRPQGARSYRHVRDPQGLRHLMASVRYGKSTTVGGTGNPPDGPLRQSVFSWDENGSWPLYVPVRPGRRTG